MKIAGKLILYRELEEGKVFKDFTWVMEHYKDAGKEKLQALCYGCIHGLAELSVSHGFEGNLWQDYLTFLMVNNENAYSISCEMKGAIEGSINRLALHDFEIFKELFDFDFKELEEWLEVPELRIIEHYKRSGRNGNVFNHRVWDRISQLSVRLEQTKTAEIGRASCRERV